MQGSSIHNIKDVFPDCAFVQYYVSGKDERFAGMDWGSLYLIFKIKDQKPYLQAIVHNEWTP